MIRQTLSKKESVFPKTKIKLPGDDDTQVVVGLVRRVVADVEAIRVEITDVDAVAV